jgi:hypothetical protein
MATGQAEVENWCGGIATGVLLLRRGSPRLRHGPPGKRNGPAWRGETSTQQRRRYVLGGSIWRYASLRTSWRARPTLCSTKPHVRQMKATV